MGDPNAIGNKIEASLRLFMESEHQLRYTFGKNAPPKNKNQKWRSSYSKEGIEMVDTRRPAVITIEDILGQRQVRKLFPMPKMKEEMGQPMEEVPTDDEVPLDSRTCKSCGSGRTVSVCECEEAMIYRTLRYKMTKRDSPDWPEVLDIMEEFCKRKRQKLTGVPKSEAAVIAPSPPGDTLQEASKGEAAVIAPSPPGDLHEESSTSAAAVTAPSPVGPPSSFSPPEPQQAAPSSSSRPLPKTKPAPRVSFGAMLMEQRDFDTAEDGQKYRNKGPKGLTSFNYMCQQAQGDVHDSGLAKVSRNEAEIRYGPSYNPHESWCTLGRRKRNPKNRVIVVNCDHLLLNVRFLDGRYKNWKNAWYDKTDLYNLSRFFSAFLRHWGCTSKGRESCDSGGWFICEDIYKMLTWEPNRTKHCCHRAHEFHQVQHPSDGNVAIMVMRSLIPAGIFERTRFQLVVEVDHDTNHYLCPLAIRACSGQKNIMQLDPLRFAAVASDELIALLPGLFHLTPLSNVNSIVAGGLQPVHLVMKG